MKKVTNKQRAERLTCLRDLLWNFEEELPGVGFNPNLFYYKNSDGYIQVCSLGAAAIHPWFIKQGLYVNMNGHIRVRGITPSGWNEFDIAANFFGVHTDDLGLVFSSYPNFDIPENRAYRVEKVMKRYGIPLMD